MALFIDQDLSIGPEEFQSIIKDLKNRDSSTLLILAEKDPPQLKIFKKKKKHSYRKNLVGQLSNGKEKLNPAYLG